MLAAGVFIGLGLSGVIPAMHYVITNGFYDAIYEAALGWLSLMAILYIIGAVIYAARIPERIWPGRFDIWVSVHYCCYIVSHQNLTVHISLTIYSFVYMFKVYSVS